MLYSHCVSTNEIYFKRFFSSLIRYISWRLYWWTLFKKINKLDGIIFLDNCKSSSRFDDLKKVVNMKVEKFFVSNSYSSEVNIESNMKYNPFSKRNQIIAVGDYSWQKGFDFVLKSYSMSKAKNKIIIKFFGFKKTNYIKHLENLIEKFDIDKKFVKFCIGFKEKDLLDEYAISKLLLFGSHSECQPISLINSCATGTPFISRNSGSIENIPGGKIVSTEEEMSLQIDELLGDKAKWEKISSYGKKEGAIKYDSKKNIKKIIKILNQI